MTTAEIVEQITSKDSHKVWKSACEIIEAGQEAGRIEPLIQHLWLIKETTRNLDMGGAFAPNQRFIDFAIKTIEFYEQKGKCSCQLFAQKYKLTNDIVDREVQYDCFNPVKQVDKGTVRLLSTILIHDKWVDYYLVECLRCRTQFKVEERDGHYKFWT